MKIFAYYRISPNPRKNDPIQNQKQAISDYILDKDFEIVNEFEDIHMSGSDMNRPAFQDMLSQLKKVDGIIIYDVSRFGRNAKEAIPLFLGILNQQKTITLVKNDKTLDFRGDSEMSIYELLLPIIECFQAEEYIKNLHIKQKLGIERYIAKNKRWGRKKIEINWKKFDKMKEFGIPNTSIAKMFGIARSTLIRRINEKNELKNKEKIN